MPPEPITTTTVPAPPPGIRALLPLALGLVAAGVLFGLPPCATSPALDLAVLAGVGLWAGAGLVRGLRWAGRRHAAWTRPPHWASPSGRPVAPPDETD
jgi:hypothetical protein